MPPKLVIRFKEGNVVGGYGKTGIVTLVIGDRIDFKTYKDEVIVRHPDLLLRIDPDKYFPRWIESGAATQEEYDYLRTARGGNVGS